MSKAKKSKQKSNKAKAKAKAIKKVKKAKSMSRLSASVVTLQRIPVGGKVKMESAVEKADTFYCNQPGNSSKQNTKEASYAMQKASKVFELLNLISIKGKAITCLKKVG